MRKNVILKTLLALMASIVMMLCFTACGDNIADIAGSYKVCEMTEGGTTITKDQIESLGFDYSLEIKDDGTFKLSLGDEGSSEGKCEKDGDNYKLNVDGDSVTLKKDGGKLVIDMDGTKMTFEKK